MMFYINARPCYVALALIHSQYGGILPLETSLDRSKAAIPDAQLTTPHVFVQCHVKSQHDDNHNTLSFIPILKTRILLENQVVDVVKEQSWQIEQRTHAAHVSHVKSSVFL